MVEAGEYSGEKSLAISATQLSVPQSRANRVIDGWIEFFERGPSPIIDLEFTTRTPARLFESLRGQTQLQSLELKWGDYADLSVLSGMHELTSLSLGGAAAVTTVEPLGKLHSLSVLGIHGSKRVVDYGPLRHLEGLENLAITAGINGPNQHADSLEFVRGLVGLRIFTFAPRIDSLDYSPLLSLQGAELVDIHMVRGMSPSAIDLEWSVPGMREAAARSRFDGERTWTAEYAEPQPEPTVEAELETLRSIDAVWSSLLDGRMNRLEAVVWARNLESSGRDLLREGRQELESLTGYPWDYPTDFLHFKLFRWLEAWRMAVQQFANDSAGEPRREAMRRVASLIASRSKHARLIFEDCVAEGLLGPDDEAALGLPPSQI